MPARAPGARRGRVLASRTATACRGRAEREPPRRRDRRRPLQRRAHGELLERALDELERAGVAREAITVMPVPGAFELPLAAMALAKTRRYACIVALGCVIRGETPHFDFVAGEAASGLQLAALETGVPVAFGVLTLETPSQADERLDEGRRGRAHGPRDGRRLRAAPRRSRTPAEAKQQTGTALSSRLLALPAADVQGLRHLREEALVRQQPEPLDGGHEAALQPEPPARARLPQRRKQRARTSARAASRAARSRRPSEQPARPSAASNRAWRKRPQPPVRAWTGHDRP